MQREDKKAYITEEEFNDEIFTRGIDDPTQDSPDDSDKAFADEIDIGVDNIAEEEDDEIIGTTDDLDRYMEQSPELEQVESSPLPSPRQDENLDTSTH